MNKCEFYGGTEKITATSTKIKCSRMENGGKVYENQDPEGAMTVRCCWDGGKNCPLFEEKNAEIEQQTFTTELSAGNDTQVSAERQDKAEKLTRQIITNGNIAASCMVEMGRDLKAVRDERLFTEMGFDSFEEYCEKKIGIGKRHGYNFIQVYEKYGEERLKQLQGFGITKLLELAKLDDEDMAELMEQNNVAELSVRQLAEKVEEYKNKYEQLTFLLEEEKSKNEENQSLEQQLEELRNQLEISAREKEELSGQLKELESRPPEKVDISDEEKNAIHKRHEAEMNKIKKQADEQRVSAVNSARRQEQEKYSAEIEKLKAENAVLQANAKTVPVSATAPGGGSKEQLQFLISEIERAFNMSQEIIDGMDDEEQKIKYRKALLNALRIMEDNVNVE